MDRVLAGRRAGRSRARHPVAPLPQPRERAARRGPLARRLLARADRRHDAARGDRKSTRLNSSHLVISYAVFCLKKKMLLSYIAPRSGSITPIVQPAPMGTPAPDGPLVRPGFSLIP